MGVSCLRANLKPFTTLPAKEIHHTQRREGIGAYPAITPFHNSGSASITCGYAAPSLFQQRLFPEHQVGPELVIGIFLLCEAMAFILAKQVPGHAAFGADGFDDLVCF